MSKGRLYICLVCHTEPDVWDGGFRSIGTILPRFHGMLEDIRDGAGHTPRVAWCLTAQVVRQRPEPFLRMQELGHEIGIHSHFPAEGTGNPEHNQEVNRTNLDNFADWFPQLHSQFTEAGFPPPRTHASWMFAYRNSMTKVLAESGILTDCSVCYGGAHYLQDGFLLADSRKRISGKPYRLCEDDHCMAGTCDVVELPVSGGLGCYWEPDNKGGFSYFNPINSDTDTERQLRLFQNRLEQLSPGEVDIFHIHFHLYEFLTPTGTGDEQFRRAKRLFDNMASDTRVRFATPSEAVEEWTNRMYHSLSKGKKQ